MASFDDGLVLRGVTLPSGGPVDVTVRGGHIEAISAAGSASGGLDLAGYLLLPAPAEPHAHLDKAYTADAAPNDAGDLAGAVTAWLRHRRGLAASDVVARATAAVRTTLANGATAIRSHVDVGADLGLRALAALAEVRAAVRDECDLQLVAFVGVPLTGLAGAGHRALLRDAVRAGADVVGGAPYLDPDPAAAIDFCLAVAGEHGRPLDLHVDETLDPSVLTLLTLADAVLASGFAQPVAASHCVSLGALPVERAAAVADRVAAAGIAVICLPQTNLYLQGRDRPVATPRGLTALRTLRAAGVVVAAGGDNVQDPFNCIGRGDPLDTAALLVLAGHDSPAQAYAATSGQARRALGLPPVELAPGSPAELLAIRAGSLREAVATGHPDRVVVHRGQLVAHSTVSRTFPAASRSARHAGSLPSPR